MDKALHTRHDETHALVTAGFAVELVHLFWYIYHRKFELNQYEIQDVLLAVLLAALGVESVSSDVEDIFQLLKRRLKYDSRRPTG